MLYLLAILVPPLAVFLCGKPFQALLNIPLTMALWVPGAVHALFVANNYYADKRLARMVSVMQKTSTTGSPPLASPPQPGWRARLRRRR